MKGNRTEKNENAGKHIAAAGSSYLYVSVSVLFATSFIYFLFIGNYVFSYQDSQTLFIYSKSYLGQFISKPGGLLEYAGAFLSQLYFSSLAGAVMLSLILVLIAFCFYNICLGMTGKKPLAIVMMMIPSSLLILFHSDFNFFLYNSIGILIAAAAFLASMKQERKMFRILSVAAFPLVFYLTGGYAWIFAGMFVSFHALRRDFPSSLLMIAASLFTILLFKYVLFLQPLIRIVYYPFPLPALFKHPSILYAFLILLGLFPALIKVSDYSAGLKLSGSMPLYVMALIISAVIFTLSRLYNPDISKLFTMEKLFYRQDWDGLIRYQERTRSRSIVAEYYFNIALSEKGQLCSRLFYGPQNYGPMALMIPWDSKSDINLIYRGTYFFYTVGLVNEAHRWAFESMVMQGYKPENIKLLIKTELLNGHYAVARKYISTLKRTLRYRDEALRYEKMLGRPDLVKSDPELGKKLRLMPQNDFMITMKDQQNNLLLLLQSNPSNRVAYEYMMAWFMLERNIDKVTEAIKKMKEPGYSGIPDHIAEAAVYSSAMNGGLPVSDSLKIDPSVIQRFARYQDQAGALASLSRNNALVEKNFGKTLWYYLDFK